LREGAEGRNDIEFLGPTLRPTAGRKGGAAAIS